MAQGAWLGAGQGGVVQCDWLFGQEKGSHATFRVPWTLEIYAILEKESQMIK